MNSIVIFAATALETQFVTPQIFFLKRLYDFLSCNLTFCVSKPLRVFSLSSVFAMITIVQ